MRFRKWGQILSGLRKKGSHSQVMECVSDSEELCFLGCGEKNTHSQGVQEAEFAVVGIGIALLRSHA